MAPLCSLMQKEVRAIHTVLLHIPPHSNKVNKVLKQGLIQGIFVISGSSYEYISV
ncbi:unnamed protein product [Sphenostylis stenocarpa]|uniref:Uncharacterized protein n=1 Tax=Sphenostylis stenocarpa TaxID=92480 RepID=A0AA86SB26_9FABA|nr:unnamed protein product [Sphenostylis stenocarpa]